MKCAFYEHLPQYTVGITRELGKSVELDVFFNSISQSYQVPNCTLKTGTLSFPNYKRPSTILGLFHQMLRIREYDLVHVNSSKQAVSAYLANVLYGLQYIYTNHGLIRLNSQETQKSDQKEHQMLPRIARNARAFVTVSHFTAKILYERYGMKPYVIHHGVDLDRFNPLINGRVVRSQFSNSDKIILSVIRLHRDKDPFTLLKAATTICKRYDARFVIIGSGPLASQAEQFIRKKSLHSRVQIVPYVSWHDINTYYAACDLFVMPSLDEAFGMVITEAAACGKPVIASKSGAFPEILGNRGCFFEPRNAEDLVDKISQLLADTKEREEVASNGYQRIIENFKWEIAAEKYLKLYNLSAQ